MLRSKATLVLTLTLGGSLLTFGLAQNAQQKSPVDSKKKQNAAADAATAVAPTLNIQQGRPQTSYLSFLLEAAREGGASVLSNGDSCDDFVSVVQKSDGTVLAAYAAYYNGHDQIRLHQRFPRGAWSTRTHVPLNRGRADIWMPQLAVDARDRVWVIWGEQVTPASGADGNWDLYARPLVENRWGKIVRLTTDAKPDINHHVATDKDGNIHVVWQAHPENNGDVRYCRFDGESWSKPLAVTSDSESDWYPRVAVDSFGTVWIAFDSYRSGDYDVYLTSVRDGAPGDVIGIANTSFYEAHASVACTADGRVWVSWEQGGHNWGKDQGYWLKRDSRDRGSALGSTRRVKVACWQDGKKFSVPDVQDALVGEQSDPSAMSELTTATDGRLWLRFRHSVRGRKRSNGRFTKGWREYVTTLSRDGWTEPHELPASVGRISVFSRSLAADDGSLIVAYSGDARAAENFHRPIQDTALVARVEAPDTEVSFPELADYSPAEPPAGIPKWNVNQDATEVNAIRAYRTEVDGKPHRILRGDLHRHTELSWDVGPGNDGSYLDFYRYMIDVAQMDFGGLTDHQGGGHYAYWWWLTEKSADLFHLAPRFVPLYGYERSARFPNGHRNVFHAERGVPVFAFQIKTDQRGVFPGIASGALVDNDTKLLYEYLHNTRGLCISHTSGTNSMGTDWRDNDPDIEPVVEIYQGARNSYEALDAPRVHSQDEPPRRAPGGFQKAGMLWNAYEKGYRLGIIASSDHGSTHISYALVYSPSNDRQTILDSIRARHTYGGTDNVIVDFKSDGHFMGDEYETGSKPNLSLNVVGTSNIARVDLIRNNEYIYSREPDDREVSLKFTDMQPHEGVNLYYFRLLQDDGEVAWASPIWVNYKP